MIDKEKAREALRIQKENGLLSAEEYADQLAAIEATGGRQLKVSESFGLGVMDQITREHPRLFTAAETVAIRDMAQAVKPDMQPFVQEGRDWVKKKEAARELLV